MFRSEAQSLHHQSVLLPIEELAAQRPQIIAVEFDGMRLTYGELAEQSDRVASRLRELGVGPGSLLAVYLGRSIDFVVIVVGILKAGAAYLPLDSFVPEKRLEYLLDDSGSTLIVTESEFVPRLGGRRSIIASDLLAANFRKPAPDLVAPEPDDLAYVIYTSGSTGRPKGVEVLHRGLGLCLQAVRAELEVGPADTVLSVTSPSFDVSVMEMFVALNSGARLVLLPPSRLLSRDVVNAAITKYDPTIIFGTPPLWRLLVEGGWKGSRKLRAVTGGEVLDNNLALAILQRSGSLWNHYGPTEATIVATSCQVHENRLPSPIGYALPHIRTFVAHPEGKIVGQGEPGELYLGGESLARGYRSHPELTASRFIDFESEPGLVERVYRTGDLVRQLPNGAFEFIGRADNQVKIRGFRIELEEVEATLTEYPSVLEAAVVVHADETDEHEKILAAYYRTLEGGASGEDLRSFLAARLPAYMIPSRFTRVDSLPLTVNGKVDRLELSRRPLEIELAGEPAASADVQDPVTRELLAIWRRLLKTPQVTVNSNFFELGGHSLLAAKLFEEIERRLHKELPLSTLFEAPTVSGLAKVISSEQKVGWSPLVKIRGGQGTPFFCVHPIGGNVLTFKNLSEHMRERPFYGLQARGLSRMENPHTSIDEMAADYLTHVKLVQPAGPYFLGGYSAGGLVAFEMARLLKARGEKVDLIVLFDSYLHSLSLPHAPQAEGTYQTGIRRPFSAVGRRIVQMRAAPDRRMGIIARDLARIWSTLKLKAYARAKDWRWNPIRLDAVSAFLYAIRNYRPKPLNARVTLFLADVNAPLSARNLPAVWKELVTGEFDVHHLATDHDRLLDAPFAAQLAATIESQIEHCLAAR